MQSFLPSKSAGTSALALEALGVLCERGGISFQNAWKLLRDARLQRPQQDLPRAAWTTLLGYAHAIAEKQPEQAAVHQHTLWEAANDPSARVCVCVLIQCCYFVTNDKPAAAIAMQGKGACVS